jgi:hypothetical protein
MHAVRTSVATGICALYAYQYNSTLGILAMHIEKHIGYVCMYVCMYVYTDGYISVDI